MNNTGKSWSVIVADDHGIIRHALKDVLGDDSSYVVVGEAADSEQATQLVLQKKPDLLILDLGLPGKSGIEVLYELKREEVATKVLVLTMYDDEPKVRHALAAGADGYTIKNISPEEMLTALDTIRKGEIYLHPRFEYLRAEIDKIRKKAAADKFADPLQRLSRREREVFYMLADGMPNRVIAKKLFISPRTVETHRARVIKKLGFHSTTDLVRYAIRHDLMCA
ncbi:MAG: DNA-binding response regulator [Candidatus Dadabacteria bacterium]|nr:MAG: DNA-binding response regulator [Candidatus Dadabacteria bacterium]